MTDCRAPGRRPSTAYKDHRCRCPRCLEWKATYNAQQRARRIRVNIERLPDDGIIDPVAVTGLINGAVTADRATYQEALQAARDTYGRDGWWAWCQDTLRLRSPRIRAIADECERVAS